jgi:hypothetical protein
MKLVMTVMMFGGVVTLSGQDSPAAWVRSLDAPPEAMLVAAVLFTIASVLRSRTASQLE